MTSSRDRLFLPLLLAATPGEIALLTRGGKKVRLQSGFPAWRTVIGDAPALCAVTGIGKVNAAAATAFFLTRFRPSAVIVTGCGGAYQGCGLEIGDLAVATAEVFGDEGVEAPGGWESLRAIGLPAVRTDHADYFNEFPLSDQLREQALSAAGALGIPLSPGTFVTVSTCSGTLRRGEELRNRFGGICENMEGAAVAQIALRFGVEVLEVRGISNMVEDRDLSRWNIPLAVERAQLFLREFLAQWGSLP